MTSHLMFDLETYGLPSTHPAPNGVIIRSIGACIFDPYTEDIYDKFYVNIDEDSCRTYEMIADEGTVEWWKTQDESALKANPQPIKKALRDFINFILNHKYKVTRYWANDPSFDKVIIEKALNVVGYRFPLPFWEERSLRTVKEICIGEHEIPFENEQKHNALSDAIYQARIVQYCFDRINTNALILP